MAIEDPPSYQEPKLEEENIESGLSGLFCSIRGLINEINLNVGKNTELLSSCSEAIDSLKNLMQDISTTSEKNVELLTSTVGKNTELFSACSKVIDSLKIQVQDISSTSDNNVELFESCLQEIDSSKKQVEELVASTYSAFGKNTELLSACSEAIDSLQIQVQDISSTREKNEDLFESKFEICLQEIDCLKQQLQDLLPCKKNLEQEISDTESELDAMVAYIDMIHKGKEKMSGVKEEVSKTTMIPADFRNLIRGRPVVVKLNFSNVEYRGILTCVDEHMNTVMQQTQEYVNGQLSNEHGHAYIRGNNVFYISTIKNKPDQQQISVAEASLPISQDLGASTSYSQELVAETDSTSTTESEDLESEKAPFDKERLAALMKSRGKKKKRQAKKPEKKKTYKKREKRQFHDPIDN